MQTALVAQKLSVHRFINPGVIVDNTSWSSNVFDTQGSDGIWVVVTLGATDIAMAALSVQESDTITDATTLASGTVIPGADFSVSPLTLPSASADNTSVAVYIPINGSRKRYFNVVATAGNGSLGTYLYAVGIYGKIEVPNTATERGLGQQAIIPG
jgi:hypothetical protein